MTNFATPTFLYIRKIIGVGVAFNPFSHEETKTLYQSA